MWGGGESFLNGAEGFLGFTGGSRQSQLPVIDLTSVFPPVIGKTVNDCASKAGAEGIFDLPLQDFTLSVFTFAERIDAEFTKHERLRIGEHLEAREIIPEWLPVMEIDIETHKIGAAGTKKFCRGVTGECAQTFGIGAFGDRDELVNEVRNSLWPAPTDDVGRNCIGHAERKHGGMRSAGENGVA